MRGRVIASFGPTPNGLQNDGINLAVPEGTPVKAAEDGVVAYAGNELKGYGNLVLVRHCNGFVTAYAHASDILVKRGETVKRGQVIAHSGQTGNVTSPQLHFEIRKGSTPVDPSQYLERRLSSDDGRRRTDKSTSYLSVLCRPSSVVLTPSFPARSCTYCHATRPERAPRVVAHSSASRRSSAASIGTR